MPQRHATLRVGLTGGIASGKSSVTRVFAELGAFVLDADEIARRLIAPGGSAYNEIVSCFGPEILDTDGAVDRPRLAGRIFRDPAARAALNEIMHPRIRAEMDLRINEQARIHRTRIAIYDAALLVETGAYRDFDVVVVVSCSREAQIARLIERDGLSVEDAVSRIDAQAPLAAKLDVADHVIDSETTLEEMRERIEEVYAELLAQIGD